MVAIQILRKLRIHGDVAVIARRGSVHEMQDAIPCTQRKADVRGRIKPSPVVRNDPDDVAAA